jgi:hypothetical protein
MRFALPLRAVLAGASIAMCWSETAPAREPAKRIAPGVETHALGQVDEQPADPVSTKPRGTVTTPKAAIHTDRTPAKRMCVVLPPELLAPVVAGQFGGMRGGGFNGMRGGINGMGGGFNGVGGGFNGVGGGFNGMGIGGQGIGGNTMLAMPPQAGMSMLSSVIMSYTGERASWNYMPLTPIMPGANGMGNAGGLPRGRGLRSLPATNPHTSGQRR